MGEHDSEGASEMRKAEELKALVERVRAFVALHKGYLETRDLGTQELGQYLHRTLWELGGVVSEIYTQAEALGQRERGINAITLRKTITEFHELMQRDFHAAVSVEEFIKLLVALDEAANILATQADQLMRSGFYKAPPEDLPRA